MAYVSRCLKIYSADEEQFSNSGVGLRIAISVIVLGGASALRKFHVSTLIVLRWLQRTRVLHRMRERP